MGIRFACHGCGKPLNIKTELAGKRGVCPQCQTRFRIPPSDAERSIPLEPDAAAITSVAPESFPAPSAAAENQYEKADVPSLPAAAAGQPGKADVRSSLLNDAAAVWYVRPPAGGQYGPATGGMLREWIGQARVTAVSLVWRDGWAEWKSAGDVFPELVPAAAAPLPLPLPMPIPTQMVSTKPTVPLTGDAAIGARKSQVTQRRFVVVGTLAAISMALIGVLIYLLRQ